MRWRVAVMIAMAVLLGAAALLCIVQSSTLSSAAQRIWNSGQNQPTVAQQEAASQAFQASSALGMLSTPLAVGSLLAVVGVLVVLAIRWQRLRPPAPAR
jgi:hypothetical protein